MILDKAQEIKHHMVAWRRDFHSHPELFFQEFRTSAKVAEILTSLGYRVRTNVGKTGVVAEIGSGAPVFAIRADMDALPIFEENDVDYKSQNEGVMHACGHDSHTSMALGAAMILAHEKFPGTVRFLFQPAEENTDEENKSGAMRMIEEGAIDGVDAIVALHVEPHTPVGSIRVSDDAASAGADEFTMVIKGPGGHGAYPHGTIDISLITAQVIIAMNQIVSRRVDPFDQAVISLGSIHGGIASNVIPSQIKINGTIRYMRDEVQGVLHGEIEKVAAMARLMGAEVDLQILIGYPPAHNEKNFVHFLQGVAAGVIGAEHLLPPLHSMGAEDFGYFLRHTPGAMFLVGTMRDEPKDLHTPTFDLDEAVLPIGSAIFVEAAIQYLTKNAK
jgi:amidohydrolase